MPTGSKTIVLSGERHGRLTIVSEKIGEKRRKFLCLCDCGKEKVVRLHDLKKGAIRSCGCLLSETSRNKAYRHGGCPDGGNSRLYTIWNNMRMRCLNKNREDYKHYGERGITVCKEWLDFKEFQIWAIENGYQAHLTIERINNNGNYEPSNCRWATRKEQRNNASDNLLIEHEGQIKNLRQWTYRLGLKYTTLYQRIRHGWSIERAFNVEVQ